MIVKLREPSFEALLAEPPDRARHPPRAARRRGEHRLRVRLLRDAAGVQTQARHGQLSLHLRVRRLR